MRGAFLRGCTAIALATLVWPSASFAQTLPQRLSDWLLAQPNLNNEAAYPLGLSWRVPEERVAQTAARLALLSSLSGSNPELRADPNATARLRELVGGMPATGRVRVALADARWLQANPGRDPVLLPGHTVILPPRPSTVTVITDRGDPCPVTHAPLREAIAYLAACMPGKEGSIDWVWIAQPDGRVQRFGVAIWNREKQDEPAPGSWMWAPSRGSGWPEEVSQSLIEFLATQGPAGDPGQALSPSRGIGSRQVPDAPGIDYQSRNPEVSSNDWGATGLMQTPSARMRKTGAFSFHFSRVAPYSQGNLFFQPFDWMETGFRYTNISNVSYGPAELSGDQSLKDKSIDAKFRLWRESAYLPEVAIGLRDLAGTGLFSGEYLVANKRTGNFDWSVGMGWGYVGARGNIRNPIGRLIPSFDTRRATGGEGGNLGLKNYFRGPASLFGGVQYQTPWERVILKLEYDGNDYKHEPQSNNQRQSSPFNVGLVYKLARAVDLTVGFERGNTLMLGVTLHTQLDGLETPKPNDPPRVPVSPLRPQKEPDWAATSRDIATQADWRVRKIEQRGRELRLTLDDPEAVYLRERIDRAASVLHRDAPPSVDRFALTYRQRGVDVAESVVDRDAWVDERIRPLPPSERRQSIVARELPADPAGNAGKVLYESRAPAFEHGLGFDYQQTLGGPDGFVLFQISAVERAKWRLREDTWIQGNVRLSLLNNYDKFKYTAPSNLPRVRTFMREYLTTSPITMPNLQATHVGKLGANHFYSLYGGYLESMFGGVGAEWLYKPSSSRIAVGVDVNAVRQREFEQAFGFRDYKVATGHATVYWDTGWNDVQARIHVGRYLARDFGATLDVSRVFKNGVTIGAFATRTNVSAAQFGEGSFDKGIYLSIPFDALLTKSTNTVGNFVWKPLTRDGGAMLGRANPLYYLTTSRNERALWHEPAPRPNEYLMPADRREERLPPPKGPEPSLQINPRPASAAFVAGSQLEHVLVEHLFRQGFRNAKVSYDSSQRLSLELANDTLHPLSRAAGRAARTALRFSPLETREIRVTLAERVDPLVTYEFVDLAKLDAYFSGLVSESDLEPTVMVKYLDPAVREAYPLALLGDIDTTPTLPKLHAAIPGLRSLGRTSDDVAAAARSASQIDWFRAGTAGAGLVMASAFLDKRVFKYATSHAGDRWLKAGVKIGDALPWLGLGAAAMLAFDGSDPRRAEAGTAALEAGGVAFLAATGLKYAVGRARPESGLGPHHFKPGSSFDAFPSRHAMVAWAVAAPLAQEYDAKWLYGAAALASLARAGSREHWVSDVVAGSLIGYGIGRLFWETSQSKRKGAANISVSPSGVSVGWALE